MKVNLSQLFTSNYQSDKNLNGWSSVKFVMGINALVAFLDVAYDQAVQEKLLLTSYSTCRQNKTSPTVGVLAAGINRSLSLDTKTNADIKKNLDS